MPPAEGGGEPAEEAGRPIFAILVSLAIVAAAVIYVAASLRRPEISTFVPTEPEPVNVGGRLVGPTTYTVDASDPDRWVYFDFSRASVVEDPGPLAWDLAFRRFHVIANGGAAFSGQGGIRALPGVPLAAVPRAPEGGYVQTEVGSDTVNTAITEWYDYSWLSHVLRPRPGTYVVRTAEGRYAKLELLSYYCPGARPGCMTFRYLFQGDGTRSF